LLHVLRAGSAWLIPTSHAAPRGMVDDAITLDAGVSERVLDLRDAIAEDAAKIDYLQQYAEQCEGSGAMNATKKVPGS